MKTKSIAAAIALLLGTVIGTTPVWAENPTSSGKGMSNAQRSIEKEERKQARPMDDDADRMREERMDQERTRERRDGEDNKGMEKQREMKSEQEQKETGKGSERGREMREEKRKKWWRFWE